MLTRAEEQSVPVQARAHLFCAFTIYSAHFSVRKNNAEKVLYALSAQKPSFFDVKAAYIAFLRLFIEVYHRAF